MCYIDDFTKANPDGTCERCSTSKFFFAIGIKDSQENRQICEYNSYWSNGIKAGVVVVGALIFLGITIFVVKKMGEKNEKPSLREEYVEA